MFNVANFTYLVQITSALIVAGIILHYFRQYRRDYLKYWSYSFFALALFLALLLTLNILSQAGFPFTSLPMFSLSLIKINAGYLQVVWLLLGAFSIFNPNSITPKIYKSIITATVLFATFIACLYAFDPDAGLIRNTLRNGSRFVLNGMAFLVAGVALIRLNTRETMGKRLVAMAFLLYGFELSFIGFHNIRLFFGAHWQFLFDVLKFHGTFELFIYPIIAIGLIIWLLEDERDKSRLFYEKLANISHTDPLTGLANRKGFERLLNNWRRSHTEADEKLQVVLYGIDQFKRINQAGGMRQGDEVLIAFGDRLAQELPMTKDLSRISGDVFACVFPDELSQERLEKLRKRISRPVKINNQLIHIDVSIGASFLTSNTSCEDTLVNAQRALHEAKNQGGKLALLFDEAMPHQDFQLQLENELRQALKNQEFVTYLQPITDYREHTVGFEILTRWLHPRRGILPPVEFLPHLAQLQLMPELDMWTLEQAVNLLLEWKNKGQDKVSIAVNLSPEGLQDATYHEYARLQIRRLDKDTKRLHIEITENSAMKSIDSGQYFLEQLQQLGVEIVVDDFGTGYSSLNYLKSFPAGKIKFDRTFIQQMQESKISETILRSLVPLCQKLDKTVVAEGIENGEQFAMARSIGFDQFQGYFFAKPMPTRHAFELLCNQSKRTPKIVASNV